MIDKPRLIVFAKPPVAGGAKSRLAIGIGKVQAARHYRAMCGQILRRLGRDPRWQLVLAITPNAARCETFGGLWPGHIKRISQGGGDLSARLGRVLGAASNNSQITLVIGTDAPQIKPADIAAAIAALRGHNAVLGPADDGGFWLIGIKGKMPDGLFDNIRWSSAQAMRDVIANLPDPPVLLRTLIDVDNVEALRQLRES